MERSLDKPQHLMVACDFSQHGLAAAAAGRLIARKHGARMTILHVIDHLDSDFLHVEINTQLASIVERLKTEALAQLEQVFGDYQKEIEVQFKVALGQPSREILKAARAENSDLILFGANSMTKKLAQLGLGSTAERVLRKANTHVLIVKGTVRDTFRRILAPIDFSPTSAFTLQYADECLGDRDTEFLLLHVYRLLGRIVMKFTKAEEAKIDDLTNQVAAGTLQAFGSFLKEISPLPANHRTEVAKGDPATKIIEQVKTQRVDLLVMGSKGKAGVGRLFIGTTTERVLRKLPCTMLVVHGGKSIEDKPS